MAASNLFRTLPVEQLQLREVEDIFHLTQSRKADWVRKQTRCKIPESCTKVLDMIDLLDSESNQTHEVAISLRLPVLTAAAFSTSPDREGDGPRLKLNDKCQFSFEPQYNGTKYCLRGQPSFVLWYYPLVLFHRRNGLPADDLAVNLVIVEKGHGKSLDGIPQALAYMGMVHKQLRTDKRAVHSIFGLATDNDQFHFLRLDVKGKWSRMDLDSSQRQRIADTLSYIHQQASVLSRVARSSPSVWSRIQEFARTFWCLRPGLQKPDTNRSLFRADNIGASSEVESGEDE